MVSEDLINYISRLLDEPINNVRSVTGGDISNVLLLSTKSRPYILKVDDSIVGEAMFQAEKLGLELIAESQTIATPAVHACDTHLGNSFLLMQYIETKTPSVKDLNLFGQQLAQLHKVTQEKYGLPHDNFIGRLKQSNKDHTIWTDFYIKERLMPQFELSLSKSYLDPKEIPSEQILNERCNVLFQNIKPSLLHGDLWNGNYLIASDGTPYLIDPAIYYGHHEVDIAMSMLFGGFGNEFYKAYHASLPLAKEAEARFQMYQLYYLLLHLNMFGTSYYRSVNQILKAQF